MMKKKAFSYCSAANLACMIARQLPVITLKDLKKAPENLTGTGSAKADFP